MRLSLQRPRGRMTANQRRALERLSPLYVVDPQPREWADTFGRDAPLGLEIGFGMGQATLAWAADRPDMNIVGVEIYPPGIGALLAGIEREGLTNLRLLQGHAALLLEGKFAQASLAEVRIWFPDPWPKRRHYKRRLIQPAFAQSLASRLRPGGQLLLATDSADYAAWMQRVLGAVPSLQAIAPSAERPATNFAVKGQGGGRRIIDFAYRRRT